MNKLCLCPQSFKSGTSNNLGTTFTICKFVVIAVALIILFLVYCATSATASLATFKKIEAMQQSCVQDPAGAAFILLFFQSNIYYNFHGKNEQQHNNIGSIPICYSKQSISILLFYVWAMKVGRTLITEFVCFLLLPSYIYIGSTK